MRAHESVADDGGSMHEVTGEIARVLEVLGAQLIHSVEESTREWADVGAAFDRLAAANSSLGRLALGAELPEAVLRHSQEIGNSLHTAVVALQHHDRLAQRLGHIQAGIEQLCALLSDATTRSSGDWLAQLAAIERIQRDEQSRLAAAQSAPRGGVELFSA